MRGMSFSTTCNKLRDHVYRSTRAGEHLSRDVEMLRKFANSTKKEQDIGKDER